MKFFTSTVAAGLAAFAFLATPAFASEPDTFVCRQPELILEGTMQALKLDATYVANDESDDGGDTAMASFADKAIAEGSCIELAYGTSVTFYPGQSQRKCFGTAGCYILGSAHALLPPEAGGKFISGFAIRLASDYEKGDLPSDVSAALTPGAPCGTVVVQATPIILDEGECQ